MKKNLLTLILLITTVCWSNNVFAQPANNECSGITDLVGTLAVAPGGFNLQFGPYDNTEATSVSDPADPGFPDTDPDTGGLQATLWYKITGDGNTYFIYTSAACTGFDISSDDYIDSGDTQMAVYTGDCDNLELVAASEDNFMVPGYGAENFAAGVVVETEVGVTYYIMIDGFDSSRGSYCITTTDLLPAACDANVDLAPDLPTEVVLCPTDQVDFTVDPATLSYGPTDYYTDTQTPTVVWVMTSADPMGFDPLTAPETADIFVGIFSNDVTLTDHTLPGTSDGLCPVGGAASSLSEVWFTAYIINYTATGGLAFPNCDGFDTTPIHVTWLADGEGECTDNCGDAFVELSADTPTDVVLCLGDVVTIAPNDATINYGGLIGDSPTPVYMINVEDPMGVPFPNDSYAGFFAPAPDPLTLEGDGLVDTIWITIALFEHYDPVTGDIIAECLPFSETVRIIYLAEDDPACAEVACEIAEGDAGVVSTMDATTICIDGEADVIAFTTSYTGMGNYGYLVTDDATGEILSPGIVSGTEFSTDFDGAGVGVCNAWGITWEGEGFTDAFMMGANVMDVLAGLGEDACFELTAPVAITREDCTPEPLETSEAGTSDDGATYTVTFTITGGSGNYSADGGTVDMNGTFTSDPIDCGTAYSFTVTDGEGQSTTVDGDAPCEAVVVVDCPIVLDVQEDCNGGENGGTVTITITGGTAPYTVAGTISDNVEGNVYFFTIGENEEYNLEITGDDDCGVATAVGILTCGKCGNDGGTVFETVEGSSIACGTATASISTSATTGDEGAPSIIVYVLHSDENDPLGSTLATNETGEFTRANAGGMSGTYFVTVYVGADGDANGEIDSFGDECTFVSANTLAVTFVDGEDLTISVSEDCDQEQGTVVVNVTVTGGVSPYTITGSFSDTDADGVFSFGAADGDVYTLDVTDSSGCGSASFASDPVECEKITGVEWLSFDGEIQTDGNFVQWVTASETNNEYFAVERSLDGKNFETIATLKATGESVVATSYNYLDRTAPAGTSYYRVTQFDFDGQNDATNVISLTRGEGSFTITNVRPVPAVDYVEFTFTSIDNTTVEVSVYDLTGRVMLKSNVEATSGINNQSIDVSTYPAGIYMISLNNGTEVATQRLVKD